MAPFEPIPFWDRHVEGRNVIGHARWEEYVPGRAEIVLVVPLRRSPFLDDGTIDPLALVVLADTMPGAVAEKVARRDRSWFAPSVDLTVHLLDHCRSPWVLAHNRARFAGDGYASADIALWDYGPRGSADSPAWWPTPRSSSSSPSPLHRRHPIQMTMPMPMPIGKLRWSSSRTCRAIGRQRASPCPEGRHAHRRRRAGQPSR